MAAPLILGRDDGISTGRIGVRIVPLHSQPRKHHNARTPERDILRALVKSSNELRRAWWALYRSVRAEREADQRMSWPS